jgi:hypothetical protein
LTSPDQYWNWQANLQGGIDIFNDKLQQARELEDLEQTRIITALEAAEAFVNPKRVAKHKDPLDIDPISVPSLTDGEALLQAIRSYNGGYEYHFDADYVVTANNLDVMLVGTGSWVGGTAALNAEYGVDAPPSPAGFWLPAPSNPHRPQKWFVPSPNHLDQGYVDEVLSCANS